MDSPITSPGDVKRLGTILAIWAHPDDESFCAGGLLAAAVQNGQTVVCVTATKGEAGVQDAKRWPPAQLGDIRAHELQQALNALGVAHHYWLDCQDGRCQQADKTQIMQQLTQLINRYQPQTILTFGPDGLTGHPDHQCVSEWVTDVTKGTDIAIYHVVQEETSYRSELAEADKQFQIYFNISRPPLRKKADCDIGLALDKDLLTTKRRALEVMPSQTEALLAGMSPQALQALIGTECFIRAK